MDPSLEAQKAAEELERSWDKDEHPEWFTDDDFDHHEYETSVSNRIKQGWVVF